MAKVHYIDYGNDNTVKIDELRNLAGEFLSVKKLAVPLTLANVKTNNFFYSTFYESNTIFKSLRHIQKQGLMKVL